MTDPRRINSYRPLPAFTMMALLVVTLMTGCGLLDLLPKQERAYQGEFVPDYEDWGRILARDATPDGFRYTNLVFDVADFERQDAEFQMVTERDFDLMSRDSQLAFLINAHNFYTVRRVMRGFPIDSIEQTALIGSALGRRDISLIGKHWSLTGLKREAMGANYRDARVIFALNWGMRGCAPLAEAPYRGETLNAMLDRQIRLFINDPRYNEHNRRKRKFYASRLIKDNREDIERDFTTLWDFAARYLETDEAEFIAAFPPRFRFQKFDKSLNLATSAEREDPISAPPVPVD